MKRFKDLFESPPGLTEPGEQTFTKSEHGPKKKKVSEQYREEGRHKPIIPRYVKSKGVGPRPTVDSAKVKLKEELNKPTPSVEEIAKKHNVSIDVIEKQLEMGMKIEKEHTTSDSTAREIALDHLNEKPDYYSKIKKYVEGVEPDSQSHAARTYIEKPQKEPIKKYKTFKEDLRQWFDPKHPKGGWKRINSKGEAIGPCAREPGEAKPKCMSNAKRASLSKKERAAAVNAKRRHDPNPERKGKPINVSNFGKGKLSEQMEQLDEKNQPTNPELWSRAKALAKSKFDVYPSAYANGWAAKWYKSKGGGWKTVSEDVAKKTDSFKVIKPKEGEHETTYYKFVTGKAKMGRSLSNKEKDFVKSYKLMKQEQANQISEGRPSQRHPLEGHEYHKKSDAELISIAKDAHKAAEAMKSHNTQAENKYRDQANDSATVRYFRKKSGMPDWYKKKYGHMKEEAEQIEEADDKREYDYEGEMVKSDLRSIIANANRLIDMLEDTTNLPEWCQNKITLAEDYISTVANYLTAEMNESKENVHDAIKKIRKEEKDTLPFTPDKPKKPSAVAGKYGKEYSTARHLARQALKKQVEKMKPIKESLQESRKKEIVKEILKKKKNEKPTEDDDKFQKDPVLGSEILKV